MFNCVFSETCRQRSYHILAPKIGLVLIVQQLSERDFFRDTHAAHIWEFDISNIQLRHTALYITSLNEFMSPCPSLPMASHLLQSFAICDDKLCKLHTHSRSHIGSSSLYFPVSTQIRISCPTRENPRLQKY